MNKYVIQHSRHHKNTITASILLTILIAGLLPLCSCVPDHTKYETLKIPPRKLNQIEKLDIDDASKPSTTPQTATPETAPPEEISLTIEQCRLYALENNLDIKARLFEPAIAQQDIVEAQAAFEPLAFSSFDFIKTDTPTSISLDASKQDTIYTDIGLAMPLETGGQLTVNTPFDRTKTNSEYSTLNPSYSTDFAFSISHPILRDAWARTNTHAIRIAHYNSQLSQTEAKLQITQTLASVDLAYWRLYAFSQELKVRKQEHKLALTQWQQAKRKVAVGKIAEIEVLRAENAAAQRLENIIKAENSLRNYQRELKRILNKPGLELKGKTVITPQTPPNPVHYNLDTDKLIEFALQHRTELLQLEIQIASDDSTIDFQRNAMLPSLSLNYTYNINGLGDTTGKSYDLAFRNRFVDQRIGLQLQVPVGNKAARSRYTKAIFERKLHLISKQQQIQYIEQNVMDAADRLQAYWQRIVASRKSTDLAQRTLQAEQRQYDLGLQISTQVLDAQTDLANAMSAQIRATVEYHAAQIDLALATGCLLQAAKIHWECNNDQ